MRSSEELQQARDEIRDRRSRAAAVDEVFQAMQGQATSVTIYRCDERHKGGRRRKLAQVFHTPMGLLFVSRIEWMPSDQLNLRPWDRHEMLGRGLAEASFNLTMTDDEYLSGWLQTLDDWMAGTKQEDGGRWLRDAPPTMIREVVECPVPAGSRGLWLRCIDHPDPVALDPARVIADTRTDA